MNVSGTAGTLPTKHTHKVDLSGSGSHDVVMEQAKSECDAMTLKTAVKKVKIDVYLYLLCLLVVL